LGGRKIAAVENQSWRAFEKLTQQIQAELAPEAEIRLGEKLVGKSGVSHQCDVVVRSQVGQLPFVCVFECNDHAEPVGLDIVRSFVARIRDLQVHQGVIVASRGFTVNAKRFARSEGVLTYTLIDAESAKWREQALVPVLIMRIDFQSATIHLIDETDRSEIPLRGNSNKTILIEVRNKRTGEILPLHTLMQYRWDDVIAAKHIPRSTEIFDSAPGEYELNDSSRRNVIVRFAFEPLERFYFSHVPIAFGRGFREEQSGTIMSSGYESVVLDLHAAMAEWPEVDPTTLAVKPEITFFAFGCMARESNSPRHVVFGWKQRRPTSR